MSYTFPHSYYLPSSAGQQVRIEDQSGTLLCPVFTVPSDGNGDVMLTVSDTQPTRISVIRVANGALLIPRVWFRPDDVPALNTTPFDAEAAQAAVVAALVAYDVATGADVESIVVDDSAVLSAVAGVKADTEAIIGRIEEQVPGGGPVVVLPVPTIPGTMVLGYYALSPSGVPRKGLTVRATYIATERIRYVGEASPHLWRESNNGATTTATTDENGLAVLTLIPCEDLRVAENERPQLKITCKDTGFEYQAVISQSGVVNTMAGA